MEILQQFETYITAQKNVAIQFIILGLGLLVLSGILHFFGKSELSNGLKIGGLVCGCFILIGGIAYLNTENKLLDTKVSLYNENKVEFMQTEIERMEKVKTDYPIYQYVFGAFIIASILVIWLMKNPFWNGVSFSVMLLFTVVLIIEAYSYESINTYLNDLVGK